MIRRFSTITVMIFAILLLSSCTLSTSLVPALSEEDGRFGVEQRVRQPFYSDADGLQKLTVRFYPEGFPGSQMPVDPGQGATIAVNYAPDDDPRFPEPGFSEWPEHQEWLPELTGDVSYAQTFCSPYPDLSGVELRVATFGADISTGTGRLKPFETVEVISQPVTGRHIGFVPGDSEVEVIGTTEGWVRVVLADDEHGWIDIEHFDELPEPQRRNTEDVTLEVYELDADSPIRNSTINASDMFDNSHVRFDFDRIESSLDSCYRFEITSPDSEPGNAITLRYDPESSYADGEAVINDDPAPGDLVFQPRYDLQSSLYQGSLDDYEWAAPLDAFEARFDPVPNTADRYLEVVIDSGNIPMNLPWSRNRPPGQRPLEVEGMPDAPQGGLIFNAAFHRDIPVGEVARIAARDLYSKARQDKAFYGLFAVLLLGTVIAGGVLYRRSSHDGR